ncbi:MAG: NAD(P)-dependent alcohol dehydrogenase [Deltaproteobacteria bacterium]|nr:NAD(P)-dependent alcohol dehydrogenase [Deltaproteobacteria bacterium]MBW2211536.1 NAD(P)-dependent alcohol dehydrogenase [Deltaproteobacteria bacterium]MBW2628617.1 NAD(P)-dependent alcohol dehydrogenase [Deltaproteobacteria bacterium]MBW2686231.1 NAD(P)-dependent alcohol dehydrogenase [Deltaproteobacteria bacterium]
MTSPDTSRVDAYAAHEPGASLTSFDYEPDVLGPHDVEIEITHCGICHSDLHLIDNDWQSSAYPLVPGHEIVGTIAQRGALITHVDVGERVGVGWQCGSCLQCEWCERGDENLCASIAETCVGRPGGFADRIRVDGRFAFAIPDALSSELAAPLLCGGITVYSPLQQHARPQSRVGVIGIGGLGHLAIRFARAMGCEVTAFSSTAAKEEEARAHGAHHFVSSIDDTALKGQRESLDLVISTVNSPLNWNRYVSALRPNGVLSFVGALAEPVTIHTGMLMARRRSVTSSPIGGRSTMREMLDFAARHTIGAQVETLPMSEVNAALDRLRRNDVRYRFVLRRD